MRTSKKSVSHTDFIKKMLISMATVVGLIATIVSVPTAAHADVIQEGECFPAVLMLRGSGEGEVDSDWNNQPIEPKTYNPDFSPETPYIQTNGNEGATISRLLQNFVNTTNPEKTVSKVRFIGIDYPSTPVPPEPIASNLPNSIQPVGLYGISFINHLIKYDNSYRIGAKNTLDFIHKDEERGCNTQYMIVSYSQGVISARLAMNMLNNETDKVISSYALGDPFQNPFGPKTDRQKSAASFAAPTTGVGRFGQSALNGILSKFLFAKERDAVNSYANEIERADSFIYRNEGEDGIVSRSLCHERDMVCSTYNILSLPTIGGMNPHLEYYDTNKNIGANDVMYDLTEFDKQVQKLAESSPPILESGF